MGPWILWRKSRKRENSIALLLWESISSSKTRSSTQRIGTMCLETTRLSKRPSCWRLRRRHSKPQLQQRRQRKVVRNLCNCLQQRTRPLLRMRMTRREVDNVEDGYYGYSDKELRDKEHNVIDLYQTAFGGVQSKCYCQS